MIKFPKRGKTPPLKIKTGGSTVRLGKTKPARRGNAGGKG